MSDISLEKQAEVYHEGLLKIEHYIRDKIDPILTSVIYLSAKTGSRDAAILGTFYRIYLFVQTIGLLKSYNHFQTVASAARSILELCVDLHFLTQEDNDELVKKFHTFPQVAVYSAFSKLREFCQKNPDDIQLGFSAKEAEDSLKQLSTDDIDKLISSNWINKKGKPFIPKHWSGIDDFKTRVNKLKIIKLESYYYQMYAILCWQIHSGSTCYHCGEENNLINSYGMSIHFARLLTLDTLRLLGKELNLGVAIPDYYKELDRLEAYPRNLLNNIQRGENGKA